MKIKSRSGILPEYYETGYQLKERNQNISFQAGLFIFILLFFFKALSVCAQTKHPLTVDEALRMVRINDVLMTPDGEKVFYSEARLDWDTNKYIKTFYMVPAKGGTPQQFIGQMGGEEFQFSPDGKHLSLLRKIDKEMQLFLIPITGGEALQFSRHKGGIESYKWAKDSKRIFFTVEDKLSDEEKKEWEKGADAFYVDEGANGKSAGRWRNLWMFDIESKKETRLTNEEFIVDDFDVSPGGKRVVFSARPNNRQNYPHLSEIYLFTLKDKNLLRLTNNQAPENDLHWAPDGETFLYRSPDGKKFDLRNGYFWIMNPQTGENRKLTAQNQGEVDQVVWMPDGKSILFNEVHGTNTNLFRLDVLTDRAEPLTNRTGTLRVLAFSKDRTQVVYSFSDFNTPRDIYFSDLSTKNSIRLTNVNPWIEKEILLGKSEVLVWKSNDGTEIEGVFVSPVNHKKGEKVPLMLDIHGGPSGYFGNEFDAYFHIYSGLGYAVLGPNVRGSSGYGDDILRGLMRDVGGGEFEDLMSGVDHVIELGYIDPDRMGVRGWSWGGVSCGWVVTHTDRFKAASCGAGVVSWLAESGPGYNFDLSLWYIGGTAWENPEAWRKHSAITYVKNVKTPTLLLHGTRDITSSTNQSMIFYTALRDLGVPTRFLKFPRQGHGIREPRLQRIRMTEEIKWFHKYVLGKQWESGKKISGLIE